MAVLEEKDVYKRQDELRKKVNSFFITDVPVIPLWGEKKVIGAQGSLEGLKSVSYTHLVHCVTGVMVLYKYILKRILMAIPVLIGATFLVFTIMYFAPGDPAEIILGSNATQESLEALRTRCV